MQVSGKNGAPSVKYEYMTSEQLDEVKKRLASKLVPDDE
jgi:hypothetical protein